MIHSQWFPGLLGLQMFEHLPNGHEPEIINSRFHMSVVVLGERDTTGHPTQVEHTFC